MNVDKPFDWNPDKNRTLQAERDVSFNDVLLALEDEKRFFKVTDHPNQTKYPNQRVYIVLIRNYTYIVPFVEDEHKIFLKTVIPSRKANKKYKNNKEE